MLEAIAKSFFSEASVYHGLDQLLNLDLEIKF